jgi:zinc D-Ala-D-Ala carboxypeptidase
MTYKYFSKAEFRCRETQECGVTEELIMALDTLRERVGFPLIVTSGFRSVTHSAEINKKAPGTHTRGIAADLKVTNGFERMNIVHEALKMGVFTGIGIHKDFIHLDMRDSTPVMWSYYS